MRGSSLIVLALLAACKPAPGDAPKPAATPGTAASAAATAEPAPAATGNWPRLQALGTEPFWSVEIATGTLRYSTPENPDGDFFPAERSVEGSRQTYTGALGGQQFALVLEPGACSDGMSDTVYPFTAERTLGEDVQRGCARPR